MDDHSKLRLAPDSAAGNHSAAAKVGGVAGAILVLILGSGRSLKHIHTAAAMSGLEALGGELDESPGRRGCETSWNFQSTICLVVSGDDFGLVEDIGGVCQRTEKRTKTIGVRWVCFYCPLDYPASNIPRYEFVEDQEQEGSRPQSIVIALQIVVVDYALLLPVFGWVWGAPAAGFKVL
ncbi:hypothetical protein SADUNF_Sadunf15G0018900 [Salix dunnii]|uniref:Uncharacterized protein n=1 Tax=Salix dunnii TaxID=1413687 RepID=A0A835JEN9_9ROSI|nr:hypothetical protein SADUNF_Sadunf15G0018900 [Salix dunnii]